MTDNQVPVTLDEGMQMLKEERMQRHIDEINKLVTEGEDTKYALMALVDVLTDIENCDREIAELLIKFKLQASKKNDWRATQALVRELQSFRRTRYGTKEKSESSVEVNIHKEGVVRMLLDEVEKRTAIEVKGESKE